MDDAILNFHSSSVNVPLLFHSRHLIASSPLRRFHDPILSATEHNKHTHSATTIRHEHTIKTTKKSSILLHNLHDDYHHNHHNYHHHTSPTPPTLSMDRSTTDQPPVVAFRNSNHTSLHSTTTTAQGTPTIAACNPHETPITSPFQLPIQHYRPLDSIDDLVSHVMAPTFSEPPALPPTTMQFLPTEFSLSLDYTANSQYTTPISTLEPTDAGQSFEARMRQQERRLFDDLAAFQQNLFIAQQEFEEMLQAFIKQSNTIQTSPQTLIPEQSLPHSTSHPVEPRSKPDKITNSYSADPSATISGLPSCLNTQYLLPSGNYNYEATGVPWFKSSLFDLLPFLQHNQTTPLSVIRTAYPANLLRIPYCTTDAPTTPRLTSRPQVPITTEQVRPKFQPFKYGNKIHSTVPTHQLTYETIRTPMTLSPFEYSNTPYYSTGPTHQPIYETIRTPMILSTSHTDDGNIYRPPWPPPHVYSSGYPAFSHSVPLGPDPSGYLCPILWPSRPIPQASYCSNHRRPRSPSLYRTRTSYWVSLPTSLTEDKNLLRPP